ncbi:TPA: hypothetical protein SMT83_000737 [Proteus mirabilis]|uniref:hypothetical protein n=1 Tax=Proteus mirabilis TaxID=584 RepID=UPI00235F6787|nr:hypothetical protein [Proteus mirabilis]MDC9743622.1 hypothetical protein [Proteus mirabilis]HEK0415889.1 hypothetical protein [Proteus mirabilis]HEK2812085.1 hypothetical protein [Proteus mirabilis]HEK2830075.1 hypothetical protein [Proteus mirabilis]HEK2841244.1 hypothetical protein [Proteus mirabilis]
MNYLKTLEAQAEALVAELFANDKTPMEQFGTSWSRIEMLERRVPNLVSQLDAPTDDYSKALCC